MTHNTDFHGTMQAPSAPYGHPGGYGRTHGYGQPSGYGFAGFAPPPAGIPMAVGYSHHARSSSSKAGAWIAGVVALLLIGGAVLWFAPLALFSESTDRLTDQSTEMLDETNRQIDDMSGANTADILRDDLDVDMGSITIDSNRYSSSGELEVALTNKSGERQSFSVEIEATSESGERIATGTAYAQSLAPGQTVDTDITFYPDGGASKYDLEDAEFDVIKVSMY